MKKLLCMIMALALVLSFAACSEQKDTASKGNAVTATSSNNSSAADPELQKFIDEQGDEFLESLKSGFEQSSGGMECECTMEAKGTELIVNCFIQGLDDVPESSKAEMQSVYDSSMSTFDSLGEAIKSEVPSITKFILNVCEEDGDILAVINVDC